jgi:hypothetical protein
MTGAGGKVVYDPRPTIRYRQHRDNAIGSNSSLAALLNRVKKAWTGAFKEMNKRNIHALDAMSERLTPGNRETLAEYSELRKRIGRLKAFRLVKDKGFYRRSLFQQISLYLGIFMRRV